jgi:hypothetical protein
METRRLLPQRMLQIFGTPIHVDCLRKGRRCWLVALTAVVLLAGCGLAPLNRRATPDLSLTTSQNGGRSVPSPSPVVALPAATTTVAPTPTLAAASPPPAGPSLLLSPTSGPPGTVVQVTGNVPVPLPASGSALRYNEPFVDVCWDGCAGGISGQVTAHWSPAEPTHFSLHFTVPALPWMGAEGPHPLAPGAYSVTIVCLTPPAAGRYIHCPPPLTAMFHLTGPVPTLCNAGPCGQISLLPTQGPSGTLVHVQGWAPLGRLAGGPGAADGYTLQVQHHGAVARAVDGTATVTQSPNGSISGSLRLPAGEDGQGPLQPGTYRVVLQHGHAALSQRFTVTAAPAWASLGRRQPLWTAWTGARLSADHRDPRRLAYCDRAGLHASFDAGRSWRAIPIAAALADVRTRYPQPNGPPPASCGGVTLDPDHPASAYVTIDLGAPPSAVVGYATNDDGRQWQPLPAPAGFPAGHFGGFAVARRTVQALFGAGSGDSRHPPAYGVEATDDGGRTWQPAHLTCPPAGPCLRWGPAPSWWSMGAAMPQWLERSSDGGVTWSPPAWPERVDVGHQGPAELVALSARTVALLAPGGPYPLRLSQDGGAQWHVISMPAIPGLGFTLPPGATLQWLPSGDLLLTPLAGPARLLLPGATTWCAVASTTLPAAVQPAVIATRLWWLQAEGSPIRGYAARRVPLDRLRCAAP